MSLDEKREQYQKQINRMADDPVGLEVIGEKLQLQLKKVDRVDGEPLVALMVPSYKGHHPKMMTSCSEMVKYAQKLCTVWSEPSLSSSLISWLRNDMVANLYKTKRHFTHVLWVDDDMEVEFDFLVKMLRRKLPIIGGLYTHRSDPPKPNVHCIDTHTCKARRIFPKKKAHGLDWNLPGLTYQDGLISAREPGESLTCGTGLMLIEKQVLDRVADFYVNCEYEKRQWGLTNDSPEIQKAQAKRKLGRDETHNCFWFQLLPRLDGWGETGEDSSFCIKAALCGYQVYVDTTLTPGHVGEYTYHFDDAVHFLKPEPEPEPELSIR